MKIKHMVMLALLTISLLAMPVLAANEPTTSNSSYQLFKPGMGRDWIASQGADAQATVSYVMGALIFGVAIVFIYYASKAGINTMKHSTEMGNPQEKSSSRNSIIGVFVALVAIVLFIVLGLGFFKWY